MKRFGIFAKVFVYTTVFLAVIVAVTVGLFYQQFTTFYNAQQMQRLQRGYRGLYEELRLADRFEMVEAARRFAEGNQSFVFRIVDNDENVLFVTPNMMPDIDGRGRMIFIGVGSYTLIAQDPAEQPEGRGLLATVMLAVLLIMVVTVTGAAIFAKQMTNPIKHLVADTNKMAKLLPIEPPKKRNDEIGDLADVVHSMYGKLKDTIVKLEDENLRRKEMEESQRYFFSAASHELKTPIAAARVVMEGMLADIGGYANHPKHLRECIKLIDEQSKTIYEILDIVNLDEHYSPVPEKINIKQIVASRLNACKPLVETNGLHIETDIDENLHCNADLRLLKKALSNVLINAVQNCPTDGQIRIFTEETANGIRLGISNTGHIADELLPRIFDPFHRADKARTRKQGRTGLGLTIVKKSLALMGAEYGIENDGECVLFWMLLPNFSKTSD